MGRGRLRYCISLEQNSKSPLISIWDVRIVDDDEEHFDEDEKQLHLDFLKYSTIEDQEKVKETLIKTKHMRRRMILNDLKEYTKYWKFYFANVEVVSLISLFSFHFIFFTLSLTHKHTYTHPVFRL